MSLGNLLTTTQLGLGECSRFPVKLTLLRKPWRRALQAPDFCNGHIRTERYLLGMNSHIEGWVKGLNCYIKTEDIKINRKQPNIINTIYENQSGKVIYSNSELLKSEDGEEFSIINAYASTNRDPQSPVEKCQVTKQTIHSDGTYGIYESCYNPETGMEEFILVKTGIAQPASVPIRRQFNAEDGIETYIFDNPNIKADIID